jgi:hypothetical protein
MPYPTEDADRADNRAVESPFRLLSLPDEILLEVFTHMRYHSLIALRLKNRHLSSLVTKDVLLQAAREQVKRQQRELLMISGHAFSRQAHTVDIGKHIRTARCQRCWSIDHTERVPRGRVDERPLCEECFDLALIRAIQAHID